MSNWIQTHNGVVFDPLNPDPDDILIEDIAHSLSHICRFCGHCKEFYSVAEHSVAVALELPPQLRLVGLLHDASEAYMSDIATPVKNLIPQYQTMEHELSLKIYDKFGVKDLFLNNQKIINEVDKRMLATEKVLLMEVELDWGAVSKLKPYDLKKFKIGPLNSIDAKKIFLHTFNVLSH